MNLRRIELITVLTAMLITVNIAMAGDGKEKNAKKDKLELTLEPVASDTAWKKGGILGLNFGQVALENWAAGGFNSISGVALANIFSNYAEGKSRWDNNLNLAYGLIKQGEGDAIKSDDKIDFTSKYGQEAWNPKWYYSALVNFRTQFTEGLDANGTRISDLFAPAYLLASLGLDFKPDNHFSVFISPATAKITIVTDEILSAAGAFGVDPGELDTTDPTNPIVVTDGSTTRSEFGGLLKATYNKELMENINLITGLDLFSNYSDNPDHIDVNWELLLSFKVNKYFNASLGGQAIYDHDITIMEENGKSGPRTQFKEVFNLGFSYNF